MGLTVVLVALARLGIVFDLVADVGEDAGRQAIIGVVGDGDGVARENV